MKFPSMLPTVVKPFFKLFSSFYSFPSRAILQRTHLSCSNDLQCSYEHLSPSSSLQSDTFSVIILDSTPVAPHRTASVQLAAPFGVETSRLQRPSIRAGFHARHLILSASFDESRKALRRRPHLDDGVLSRPGNFTGRLHQHQGLMLTSHQLRPYPSLSTAPSGNAPVSRKRHKAMSNLRATATIPMRLKRLPPPPKRSRNHTLRALSG
jgi:hypothetical protein